MENEEKKLLQEEVENVRKSMRSLGYQHKFWQRKAAVDGRAGVLQAYAQITGNMTATAEYLKFLEDLLNEDAKGTTTTNKGEGSL